MALDAAGMLTPRDTYRQEKVLGEPLDVLAPYDGLRRGDLMFWKGHVGMMQDSQRLLHANGHHMLVVSESLKEAVDRIAQKNAGPVTSVRRLASYK